MKNFTFCFIFAFLLFDVTSQQTPEFFEGINPNSPLEKIIQFPYLNISYLSASQILFNNTKYDLSYHSSGTSLPSKCSNLYLEPSNNYYVIKPRNSSDSILDLADLKLPFSSVLSPNFTFLNRNFCMAFNKKNYAIGFDTILSIPCMSQDCFVHLSSISLSTENGLVINNLMPIVAYDSMRYHHVQPSKQFNMKFQIGMPLSAKNLIYYSSGNKKGFHFRMFNDLYLTAEINSLNFLGFRSQRSRLDLFYNGLNLISFDNLLSMNGLLRDSPTNALNTCYPSGLYSIVDLNATPSKILGSRFFASIIGPSLFELKGRIELAFYMNMRTFKNNGFFLRTDLKVNLFNIFKVSIDLEIQKVNSIEMQRRVDSMQTSSFCPDTQMSKGTKYLMDKFTRSQDSELLRTDSELREWNRFFSVPNGYYFLFQLTCKAKLQIPLMDNFKLSGELNAFFVMPSPRNNGDLYYGKLDIKADLFGFISVGVKWDIDDRSTDWKCIGTFSKSIGPVSVKLFDVNVHLTGPSDWLYEGNYGGLIKSAKKFVRISITPNFDTINEIVKKAEQAIKEIAQTCEMMWNAIKNDVKKAREEIKNVTDKLCFNPPCLISNLLATIGSIFASAGAVFTSIFGRKKKEVSFYGYNEFKCPIYKVVIKKCVFRKCSTVAVQYDHDKVCMDRVRAEMLEMKHKEELANWKENVVVVNVNSNLGIQHVLEQTEHQIQWFNESDIHIHDITYNYNVTRDDLQSKFYRPKFQDFDPNNTTFFDEFDNNLENIFEQFDDSDVDIDPSEIYVNNQELNLTTTVTIDTRRLSNLFKGKDNVTVTVTMPANFDFTSEDLLYKTTQLLINQLSDKDSDLVKAIIGDNVAITDDLIDAYGMNPPIISLKNPLDPIIYCDDPEIEEHYGGDDNKVVEGLRKHLTPITFEQIFRRCKSNIEHHAEAACSEHESICGATKCRFARYVYDGCGQKSNVIYEDMVILPKKPYFIEFPENIPLSCDENKNITQNEHRFIMPKFHPGCRNVEIDILYEDSLNENKCNEFIYRKWRVEMIGCERTLYSTRNQKIFIQDKKAPEFSSFPQDKTIDFFHSYGTEHSGVPSVYDTCGHGPSQITYKDSIQVLNNGERLINRTWSAIDACGNQKDRVQKIHVKNLFRNDLNSNFKNFVLFSFNETILTNSVILGPLGSREKITLINSTIGNDEDYEDKCVKRQKWTVLSGKRIQMEDTSVHGSIKSLSDFDFDKAKEQAIELSRYLNDSIQLINVGAESINCLDKEKNLSQDYPIDNFFNSECIVKKSKYFTINTIDETDLNNVKTIELKGNELLYNLFYFKNTKLFENKELRIRVPPTSVVIINFENKNTTYFNMHKIRFDMSSDYLINPKKIIYNFLNDGDIVFEENDDFTQIDGTILAPYSNFIKVSSFKKSTSSGNWSINGQIFAK
ncbi:unnamed protein product, partial [Brachionus calyciflorus]